MSAPAAVELERAARSGAGAPRCSVLVPLVLAEGLPPEMLTCPLDGVAWVTGRCPCGHVRDGWLCKEHLPLATRGGCRACLEAPEGAHDCPLAVTGGVPWIT